MMKTATTFLAAWVVLAVVGTSNSARATPICPGFDLFATAPSPPDPQTFVDLTIPSGGLVGIVPLKGDPFGPGDTDTIVERITGSGAPFDLGDVAPIDIELVALSLVSVDPVDIGGTDFIMHVISGSLLGEPANPLGLMTVTHSDPNGGTFVTDLLPINYKATFTEVGNLLNTFDVFSTISFTNTNGHWSHSPGPMDQHNLILFDACDFFAGIDPITGEKRNMDHIKPGHRHFARAAMPEPSTCALAALGFVGLIAFGWRRRKR